MLKLLLLCLGTTFLMLCAQREYLVQYYSWGERRHYIHDRTDIYMLIIMIWMTCFYFLRTYYNDTANYISAFLNAPSISEGAASGIYYDWMENPLSMLYRDLMRSVTKNYHVYFLLPAILQNVAVVKLYRHYSVSPAMSLLIYFCLGTYVLFMAAFKQAMAMTILLLALPYAHQKKYVTYVLLVILATLFHFYAIVYLLVPLMFGEPWGTTTWILLGAMLVTLTTYDQTLGALMAHVDNMGGDIAEEELFDGHSINALRVAVYWVPGLLALIFRHHVIYQSTRMENLFVNLSVLCACVLTIGLAEGANLYGRMAGYFEWAIAVTIPLLIKKIFDKRSATFVTAVAVIAFLGYFGYEFTVSKAFSMEYRSITLWQFFMELLRG